MIGGFALLALGAVGCAGAPATNAPSLAATAAALQPSTPVPAGAAIAAAVAAPMASATLDVPTPTPTLVPPKPTVTPTPVPPTPTPVVRGKPQEVEIPKLAITAPVVGVKTTPEGDLGNPEGPDLVGWWMGGPRPGDPGNAVLTGHLDWAGPPARAAVFWRLKELSSGDKIVVKTDQGERVPFVVEWTKVFSRDSAPVEQLLGFQIGRVITVITCEGQFIPSERDYTERRIVRAKLAMA